ncbi:MAG TPA: tRNA (adenosine(37)-N6)-threonylcarbamoyltransferase complex transferase subunit TsaD [Tepidisphaeraceae bacterium]|jgi:N6-L-threonylcarbamoyladenine synthase
MATLLAIESTCDETAASVVTDGLLVRSNVVAAQTDLHQVYRGVVPEIASRAHIENILPMIRRAMDDAGCGWNDIDAIAVAQRPGLIGSLLIGVTAAKTLAWSLGKPLIGVDHVQAHLYSVMLSEESDVSKPQPNLPAIGLVCSGGHTALYLVRSWTDVTLIGRTIDDAVGEAYDKVAAMLGLPYPGGPTIDQLAAAGNPKAVTFPRSRLGKESLDFSFSGLKTSVLYEVRGHKGREKDLAALTPQGLRDICASFQQACVDILQIKIDRACEKYGIRNVIVGGGVSANRGLRAALPNAYFPALAYCTDNAAMIGGLGHVLLTAGRTADWSMDAVTHSIIPTADVPA